MFVTQLSDGDVILVVTNWRAITSDEIYFNLDTLGIKLFDKEYVHIRDLWAQKDIGTFDGQQAKSSLMVEKIPPHGSKVYRFNIVKKSVS